MKKTRILITLLCTLILSLPLASCSSEKKNEGTVNSHDKMAYESYVAQLDHYMELVGTLQNELMEEKEENFIIQCQYKLEIEELQNEILSLKKHGSFSTVEDNDNEASENPDQHEEAPKQFDETAAKSQFVCKMVGGKLTVVSFIGDDKEVVIPSEIDGVPIRAIGDSAFQNTSVTKVIIPEGIETIGWFAFSNCKSLRVIYIPSSVTSVEYGAFEYCGSELTIVCESGSYIESYAQSWGIKYTNE